MKAIKFEEYGGPEVLKLLDIDKPEPAENEVLIEVKAIGVNYADTARREGQYVVPTELPYVPGSEVAGVVVGVGSNVKNSRSACGKWRLSKQAARRNTQQSMKQF